jgi:hypothetical protein
MGTFSVFNIGTGHTKAETNLTMKVLYDDCVAQNGNCINDGQDYKIINDGPVGAAGNILGWSMNDALRATMVEIRKVKPDRVNLTGHSRGAITCHMIAEAIRADKDLLVRQAKISLILLDPVHQSKIKHVGAEKLKNNPNLLKYRAILMENVNSGIFPFKQIKAADATTAQKITFITMPGTHGSGTQPHTNPIGQVCLELIRNFMRKRGTTFHITAPKLAIEMCELFARIHEVTLDASGKRRIWDDGGNAIQHVVSDKTESLQGFKGRARAVKGILAHNAKYRQTNRLGQQKIFLDRDEKYFFNTVHAKYFKQEFPNLFDIYVHPRQAALTGACRTEYLRLAGDYGALGRMGHLFLSKVDSYLWEPAG